jgi:hypothetical protein
MLGARPLSKSILQANLSTAQGASCHSSVLYSPLVTESIRILVKSVKLWSKPTCDTTVRNGSFSCCRFAMAGTKILVKTHRKPLYLVMVLCVVVIVVKKGNQRWLNGL